jgi:hypothetical protein
MRTTVWLAVALAIGCGGGDDDGGEGDAAPEADAAAVADAALPQAGTITVEATVSDASGKILVGFVYEPGGDIGTAPTGMCASIETDPDTVSATVKARVPEGNPCDLEDVDAILEPGDYVAFLGVFVPGSMTPDQCAELDVEVDGDVAVTAPAFSADACP